MNKRNHIISAAAVIVMFICIQDLFLSHRGISTTISSQTKEEVVSLEGLQPPTIYTYFTKNKSRQTNTDDKEQDDMRELWESKWRKAGWNPVFLTEDDARKHPMFDTYQLELDKLKVTHYDHICFHRWMAMSVVGGGFMADYDTIPLHISSFFGHNLPNDGKFTVYDFTHRPVPGLLSGNRFEWENALKEIMKYVPEHEGEFFNDMRALQQLVVDKPEIAVRDVKVATLVFKTSDGKIRCSAYEGMYAIHFSHRTESEAIKDGFFTVDPGKAVSRAYYIRRFHRDWYEQCFDDS